MEQTKTSQEKSPKLYSHYDNQYNFNDLQRLVDTTLPAYLDSIDGDDYDKQQIKLAVYNLLNGIGDNTVTFKNGRFVDSEGRYRNGLYYDKDGTQKYSDKKKRDYYGVGATFLFNQMNRVPRYQEEVVEKPKWNNSSTPRELLLKGVFNSTTPDINYFLDLDPYNEETGTRGVTNRAKAIKDWIDSAINDSIFNNYDYSDQDKAQFLANARKASEVLSDNSIDPGDYLYLSRAFPDIKWDNLFTKNQYVASQDQDSTQTTSQDTTQDNQNTSSTNLSQQEFIDYVNQYYSRKSTDDANFNINTNLNLGNWTKERYYSIIKGMTDQQLYKYLKIAIQSPSTNLSSGTVFQQAAEGNVYDGGTTQISRLIMAELMKRNKVVQDKNNPDIFYIPEMSPSGSRLGYYYDNNSKTLYRKNKQDIPYWQNIIYTDFSGKNPNENTSWTDRFFTTASYKSGGIIKAQTGVKFGQNANYYTGVFLPSLDYILEGLGKDKDYYKWLNNMQSSHSKLYKSAGTNWQNIAYHNSTVGDYQNQYKAGYNGEWGDDAIGYNSLGIQNAQNLGMFDVSGRTRTSGDWSNKQYTTDNLYSAITDYRRLLGRKGDFTPEQLKEIQEKFKNKGFDYYLDSDDYYKLRPLSALTGLNQPISIPTVESSLSEEPNLSKALESSTVDLTQGKKKDNLGKGSIEGLAQDLMGSGRLFLSLHTNRKIENILKNANRPYLINTYERYSPVTGAFSEMQFRNRQAADLRRQANRPFTSDSRLQLAGKLEADRQARDLEYQGFLADDKEIKRTQAEALARQEDNMARRSQVTNANRKSIIDKIREDAQIEVGRRLRDYQGVDNFLKETAQRRYIRMQEDKQNRMQAAADQATRDYNQALQDINNWYTSIHPNATQEEMMKDPTYTAMVRKAVNRRDYELGIAATDPYRIRLGQNIPKTYSEIIAGFKQGGRLKPSSMYLIKKVIRDENNS